MTARISPRLVGAGAIRCATRALRLPTITPKDGGWIA